MEWNPPKFKVLGIWFTNDLDNCEKNNYSEKFAEVKCLLRKFINTNHKWKNIALVNYPFIKNIEYYGPSVANTYSKCNAFWTQVFKAYDEFHNKIKLTNAGEVLSEPVCFKPQD